MEQAPYQARMRYGTAITCPSTTTGAERVSTAKCARPPSPTLLTLFTRTGSEHGTNTTSSSPTRSRSLLANLIVCASPISSASSPTTHASVPWHLLDKQSGPKNPLCSRPTNEPTLCLTDHPCTSRSLLADDHVLTRPLAETRQAHAERQHHQHRPTSEGAQGDQRAAQPSARTATRGSDGRRTSRPPLSGSTDTRTARPAPKKERRRWPARG